MSDIPWDKPATIYVRTPLVGGPPRERAESVGMNLRGAVVAAMGRSHGPTTNLVIKLDDGSGEIAGDAIVRLFDRMPINPHR